jgi:hypothetical protein
VLEEANDPAAVDEMFAAQLAAEGGRPRALSRSPTLEVNERCKSGESLREGLARRDREWSLNDGRIPCCFSRRTCSCEYGLQSRRGKPAGVAKRPRERSPTRKPDVTIVAVKVHAAALSWTAAESEPGECCRQQPVRLEEVSVAAVDAAFDALLRQGPPALHKTPSLTLREEEEQEPAAATEDAEEVRAPFNV